MICRALGKLVTRASGDQATRACGNLQLCAGLEAVIEGETQDLGQQRLERSRARRRYEEARRPVEEEETESAGAIFNNLNI